MAVSERPGGSLGSSRPGAGEAPRDPEVAAGGTPWRLRPQPPRRPGDGQGHPIKTPAVPTEADHIRGVKDPGKYDATVGSEAEARRIVRQALPDAAELPPAVPGQPYPNPPSGVQRWFQAHPPDAAPGSNDPNLPHLKYADWTGGKKFKGGSWGHLYFPPSG